jgi:Flp pilus assembly protein TadG
VLTTDSKIGKGNLARSSHVDLHWAARARNRVARFKSEILRLLKNTEAAELLEFALALPLILVMVIGLLDFAHAYNLKQKLANAAREGARLAANEGTYDITDSAPSSVTSVKDDVTTYLSDAGVNTSFMATSMTYNASAGVCTATYYKAVGGVNYGLMIERCIHVDDSSGVEIPAVRVTLSYPYNWTYGFNHIIKLLIPSANFAGTINIQTDATMSY